MLTVTPAPGPKNWGLPVLVVTNSRVVWGARGVNHLSSRYYAKNDTRRVPYPKAVTVALEINNAKYCLRQYFAIKAYLFNNAKYCLRQYFAIKAYLLEL